MTDIKTSRNSKNLSIPLKAVDDLESPNCPRVVAEPRVVARESDVSVRAGSQADLECVATGNPQPILTWRKLRPAEQGHKVTSHQPLTVSHLYSQGFY